ncbi:MAG: sigma-70 family RNA polymerase sigma factor [Thermoleophilaceae bacterium]|nr:sigma-70 family RNA polymerase sigma factor [Thermoleophilaceae bacterium]
MGTASLRARAPRGVLRSKRLLALAGDERLVEQIRRGNEAAFEVVFERHGAGILGFCRHMLGSPEEAEDAVQHTFAAAFRDLQRRRDRELALKPWLYTIARNRCLSLLRSRRERVALEDELPTAGLAEQVERRAELRELLRDLRDLPEEQRAALLLAELADLPHAEVAAVLGCERTKVKALVFRARSGLIQRREARETSCSEIREKLANLRGGALRRQALRHHLRACPGCRAYRAEVERQRRMLGVALPVVPSAALKSSVLSAIGLGGGATGGGLAAGGGVAGGGLSAGGAAGGGVAAGGGAAGGGLAATVGGLTGSLGAGGIAKLATVGVLAGGGALVGEAALDGAGRAPAPPDKVTETRASPPAAARRTAVVPAGRRSNARATERRTASGAQPPAAPAAGRSAVPGDVPTRRSAVERAGKRSGTGAGRHNLAAPDTVQTRADTGRKLGDGTDRTATPPPAAPTEPGLAGSEEKRATAPVEAPAEAPVEAPADAPVEAPVEAPVGRGPIEAPPPSTPVRRGPPAAKPTPPREPATTKPPAATVPPSTRAAEPPSTPRSTKQPKP